MKTADHDLIARVTALEDAVHVLVRSLAALSVQEGEVAPLELHDVKRQALIDALAACHGSQRAAAVRLGVSPRVINYQMKIHGLQRKRDGIPLINRQQRRTPSQEPHV